MSDIFDLDEDEPKKQTGMIVVAGGLGVLLLVINLWPDSNDNEAVTLVAPVTTTIPDTTIPAESAERKISWPELLLSDVIRNNPFQLNRDLEEALEGVDNPASRSRADEKTGTESDTGESNAANPPHLDSAQYPVRFVFRGPRGAAAMIRDTVYHEGDEIDGMQIVRIAEHGVTLQHLPVMQPSDER